MMRDCRRSGRVLFRRTLIATLLLACAGGLSAQQFLRQWRVSDGLPENRVQSFAQTTDGLLWIGTSGGLVSFDGSSFEVFDHSNTPSLEESSITALFQADGVLWIGTDGGGLLRYVDRRFTLYAIPGVAPGMSVRSILRDGHGRMWMNSDSGTVSWKDVKGKPQEIQTEEFEVQQLQAQQIQVQQFQARKIPAQRFQAQPYGSRPLALALDASGGLVTVPSLRFDSQRRPIVLRAACRGRDGRLWVGTEEGLFAGRPGDDRLHPIASMRLPISVLHAGRDGRLWVGTVRDGLFQMRDGHIAEVKGLVDSHAEAITALFEDSDATLWIGTQAGMFQMLPSTVEVIHLPERHQAEFGTVYLDPEGALWVAGRHLFQINNGVTRVMRLPQLHGADVRSVLRGHDGTLWLGTSRNGVFRMRNGITDHFDVRQGLAGDAVRILSMASDGSVWVGTDDGLSHITGEKIRTYRTEDGLAHPMVHAVVEDVQKDIWVGTAHGLNHLHNGEFVPNAATSRTNTEKVWSMTSGPEGEIWIGTRSGGLYCWYQNQVLHFSTKEGLASNSIYKILFSAPDRLWLSGPGGISAVSRKSLLTQAQTGKEIVPSFFYASDERGAINFYGGIQSSGAIGAAGDVWFPSDHGPIHINVHEPQTRGLNLRINSAIADGKDILQGSQVVLTPDENELQIGYGAVHLLPQDGVRYRYRLEGVDSAWTYAQTRRTAYYTNLPAGTFRFRLQAYEAGFAESQIEASLRVVKGPHFYSTAWFRLLAVVLLCLILWTVHRMRIHLHRQRLRAVFEERLRLSREVHDTLLQGCAGVSSLLEACRLTSQDLPEAEVLLGHARDQISITMDDARRAIEGLRSAEVNCVDVRTSMDHLAQKLQQDSSLTIGCSHHGADVALPADCMHEVVMVAREAIYNALIHSEGNRVEVQTWAKGALLCVDIRDDGRGMDPASPPKDGHYGLVSMRERVENLGGSFKVRSEPGAGTVVVFRVPIESR